MKLSVLSVLHLISASSIGGERGLQDATTCEEVLAPDPAVVAANCTDDGVGTLATKEKFGANMTEGLRPYAYLVEAGEPAANEPFACLLASGALPYCETSHQGATGQRIVLHRKYRVNMPSGFDSSEDVFRDIRIHTPGNTNVVRDDFPKWTRWYQEYKNVQIFRINEGEYKVDSDSRGRSAARIEAEGVETWTAAEAGASWRRFKGTYTIIKANDATIFQSFTGDQQWSVILEVDRGGVLRYVERRDRAGAPGGSREKVVFGGESVLLRPFEVVVCDNGEYAEVFVDGASMSDGVPYGGDEGNWPREEGARTHFRWGTYVTSENKDGEENFAVDSLTFVAGSRIETVVGSACGPESEAVEGQCSTGVVSDGGDVCCSASCGACGGTGCGARPGGASSCCAGGIREDGRSCDEHPPPCVMS